MNELQNLRISEATTYGGHQVTLVKRNSVEIKISVICLFHFVVIKDYFYFTRVI